MNATEPLTIGQSMKRKVISISEDATVVDAVNLFIQNHIGTLPVVDEDMKLVGLVTMDNLLSMVLPDFVRLVDNFNFVRDLGAVETRKPSSDDLHRPIREIMTEPIFVEEDWSLIYATAHKRTHGLRDIPVVDSKRRLTGIASHVDIGTTLMQGWNLSV